MGVVREARIHERSSRARLAVRHNPYWKTISEGAHIGYYSGPRGGRWIARYRKPGSNDRYVTAWLGSADDAATADGDAVLDFKQALERANRWIKLQASGGRTLDPNLSVKSAVESYIDLRNARSDAQGNNGRRSSAHYNLRRHVLTDPALSDAKLRELSEADLRSWQRRLSDISASTKERVATDLKAALNSAFEEHRRALPSDLPITIKHGLKTVFLDERNQRPAARENQVLTDEEIRTILSKAREMDRDGDHYLLSVLLAATGARFSQIARMRVGDIQPALNRVLVPVSRKGRGKSSKPIPVQIGADVFELLKVAIADRLQHETLLERWRYRQIKPTEWERVSRGPWTSASEMTRWWNTVVAAAGHSGVIPYSLRHSSIVRAIGARLPIRLVAANHDTSVVMIEKHYARWIAESLETLSAQAVVPLV